MSTSVVKMGRRNQQQVDVPFTSIKTLVDCYRVQALMHGLVM